MKTLIDTEIYLSRVAPACSIEIERALDDWTYLYKHGDT